MTAHSGTAAPAGATVDDSLAELLAEDVETEAWDASRLPDFST